MSIDKEEFLKELTRLIEKSDKLEYFHIEPTHFPDGKSNRDGMVRFRIEMIIEEDEKDLVNWVKE